MSPSRYPFRSDCRISRPLHQWVTNGLLLGYFWVFKKCTKTAENHENPGFLSQKCEKCKNKTVLFRSSVQNSEKSWKFMDFCTNRPLQGTLRGCTKMASDRCSKCRKWLNCAAYRTKSHGKWPLTGPGMGNLQYVRVPYHCRRG